MANPHSDPNPDDPFSTSGTPIDEGQAPPSWEEAGQGSMPDDLSSSVALDMARLWVQQHQKATMLGAFAVGVFVGAMFRE